MKTSLDEFQHVSTQRCYSSISLVHGLMKILLAKGHMKKTYGPKEIPQLRHVLSTKDKPPKEHESHVASASPHCEWGRSHIIPKKLQWIQSILLLQDYFYLNTHELGPRQAPFHRIKSSPRPAMDFRLKGPNGQATLRKVPGDRALKAFLQVGQMG